MAVFSVDTVSDMNDSKQIKSYLYKLNEQLKYMFANLDPDENYSEVARVAYVTNGERVSTLEVRADGIVMSVQELDASAAHKATIISEINLSSEGVAIKGDLISLNGAVAVNNSSGVTTVSIDPETGTLTAINAAISGNITGSNIIGSNISGSNISGSNISGHLTLECGDYIKMISGNSRDDGTREEDWEAVFGGFTFNGGDSTEHFYFGTIDGRFQVSDTGGMHARQGSFDTLYVRYGSGDDDFWDVRSKLSSLSSRVSALESKSSSSSGPGSSSGGSSSGGPGVSTSS